MLLARLYSCGIQSREVACLPEVLGQLDRGLGLSDSQFWAHMLSAGMGGCSCRPFISEILAELSAAFTVV